MPAALWPCPHAVDEWRLHISLRHVRLIVDVATVEDFPGALLARDGADDQLPTADGP